jgi:hypothetical protein
MNNCGYCKLVVKIKKSEYPFFWRTLENISNIQADNHDCKWFEKSEDGIALVQEFENYFTTIFKYKETASHQINLLQSVFAASEHNEIEKKIVNISNKYLK